MKKMIFLIPDGAGAKIISNKHGFIITAKPELIDKIRLFGEVDPETKIELKVEKTN